MGRLTAAVTCLALAPLVGGLVACSRDDTAPPEAPPAAATSNASVARLAGGDSGFEYIKGLSLTVKYPALKEENTLTNLQLCSSNGGCTYPSTDALAFYKSAGFADAGYPPPASGSVTERYKSTDAVVIGPSDPIQTVWEFSDRQRIRMTFQAADGGGILVPGSGSVNMRIDSVDPGGNTFAGCQSLPGPGPNGAQPPPDGDKGTYATLEVERTLTVCGHTFKVPASSTGGDNREHAEVRLIS